MTARIKIKYKKDGDEEEVKMDVRPKNKIKDLLTTAVDFWEDGEDADDFVFLKEDDKLDSSSTVQEEGIVKDDTLVMKKRSELSSSASSSKKGSSQPRPSSQPTSDESPSASAPTTKGAKRERQPSSRDFSRDQGRPSIRRDEDIKLWIENEIGVSRTSLEFTSKEDMEEDKKRYELTDVDGHRFEIITEGETVIHYRPILND